MNLSFRRSLSFAPLPVVAVWLALAAGCASEGDRPPRRHAASPALPTLSGRETFFGGIVAAEILVGALTGFEPGDGESGGRRDEGGHRRGGGLHLGGGGGPGGGRHHPAGDGAMRGMDNDGRAEPPRVLPGAGGPPVMIHLRFTNTGPEPVDLVISDFLSPLGNFVVAPAKLRLEPGQSAEVEPMTSRLAGEAGTDITLALRLGPAVETKIIPLAVKAAPPAPPAERSGG